MTVSTKNTIFKTKKLKINSTTYIIKKYKRIIEQGNVVLHGDIKHDMQYIRIATEYPLPKQLVTLLHEAFHGIDEEYGLELDEDLIDRIAKAFYAFMLDNKEFIKEIIST